MEQPAKGYIGLEAVRRRPAMYVGNPDQSGLNCCVLELIANSIEEHLVGRGSLITVTLHNDGSLSVADEGGGICVAQDSEYNIPFIELVLTGFVFRREADRPRFWPGGIGPKCVNAVSEWMRVNTVWAGIEYEIAFARGHITNALTRVSQPTIPRGSMIRFKPDPEIFESLSFDRNLLAAQLNRLLKYG